MIDVPTEKDDKRIKLDKSPHPYIGQLTSVFLSKDKDGNSKSVPALGTAFLIQPEELSVITIANTWLDSEKNKIKFHERDEQF